MKGYNYVILYCTYNIWMVALLSTHIRGCSSTGRASALHAEGRRFDPCHLQRRIKMEHISKSSGGLRIYKINGKTIRIPVGMVTQKERIEAKEKDKKEKQAPVAKWTKASGF